MYTRGKIEDIETNGHIEKLLKAIWFELVELNNNIKKENK